MDKIIKIANGQGFWGDSSQAPIDLVEKTNIDYLTMDYLAEVTLSIMQKQKNKNPKAGYALDFILFLKKTLPLIKEKGIKVITNAGGVNPYECRQQILNLAKDLKIDIKIAVISGDDIFSNLKSLVDSNIKLNNLDTDENIDTIIDDVCSANVYIDSFNIADALELKADIVLTGRVSDPGLVLGPCIYEFGWSKEDYDLLHTLRAHGWDRGLTTSKKKNNFNFINSGFNLRPMDVTAAIGLSQLKRLNKMIKSRSKNRKLIINKIKNHRNWNSQYSFFEQNKNLDPSWFGLPLLINENFLKNKEKFLKYLNYKGVETRPILSGNFLNQPSCKLYKFKFNKKNFKVSQEIEDRGFFIGLPTKDMSLNKLNFLTENLLKIKNH